MGWIEPSLDLLCSRRVVECRNGERYMVVGDLLMNFDGYNFKNRYNNELCMPCSPEFDIMKIFELVETFNSVNTLKHKCCDGVEYPVVMVWRRE